MQTVVSGRGSLPHSPTPPHGKNSLHMEKPFTHSTHHSFSPYQICAFLIYPLNIMREMSKLNKFFKSDHSDVCMRVIILPFLKITF